VRLVDASICLVDSFANSYKGAERILRQTGSETMHTWILSSTPSGHVVAEFGERSRPGERKGVSTLTKGEKTFFLGGRIMAGQADLKENNLGFKDFKWLAKDEVQKQVSPWYWSKVQNMLRDR